MPGCATDALGLYVRFVFGEKCVQGLDCSSSRTFSGVLKITIRQAPILSAMRIKFVGSVNNKKQACSLLQILNIKKSVPADWQMRKGEKLGQTVIGKPSDRDT